jgi:Domain of unknown function (DUF1924)
MQRTRRLICAVLLALPALGQADIHEAMDHYNPQQQLSFDARRGDKLWHQKNIAKDGKERDCTVCHGTDLKKSGKHIKTGKVIDPMAPSVNGKRYTDVDKVEKWLLRNCKWTFGRECTSQEKGDLLKYLSQF